jgi:hypothetical protein
MPENNGQPVEEEDELKSITDELSPRDSSSRGRVMGQISTVTEESEKGTNVVMGFLENVLTAMGEQRDFVDGISRQHREKPDSVDWNMVCTHIGDISSLIEEEIYAAMDAFQFQDIGRQKLMKVMYTLGKLNEYLNELLGQESSRDRQFGRNIDKKTLEKDKDKDQVDALIAQFQMKG